MIFVEALTAYSALRQAALSLNYDQHPYVKALILCKTLNYMIYRGSVFPVGYLPAEMFGGSH